MDTNMTLERDPAELVDFSLAVQESLRARLGDSLVDAARSVLEMQRKILTKGNALQPAASRLPLQTEKALLRLLAEIVLADGVVCSVEDEAANTYILDHLAVDDADGERLLHLYDQAKNGEFSAESYLVALEREDREAIYDACCKVAWADQQLKAEEEEALRSIAIRLGLDQGYAQARLSAYGAAMQQARVIQTIYTHVETLETVKPDPIVPPVIGEQPDWLRRSIELLAVHHLTQKKGARVNAKDLSWCSVLGVTDQEALTKALKASCLLSETPSGFILNTTLDEAAKRQLQNSRNEATLLRLLIGNGAPLTSRFLSFRINPPKAFPELELIRLAENSPALVRYGIGSGSGSAQQPGAPGVQLSWSRKTGL